MLAHAGEFSSSSLITSVASSIVSGSVCSSSANDDVSYADCQPFCEPGQWRAHCGLCKCKSCHFCGCTSSFAEDSSDRQCQSWCSADYYADHCSRCKCSACDFCAQGPPCTPRVADDIAFEACQEFCSAEEYEAHCDLCKCKGCGFCKKPQLALAPTCTSGIEGDVSHETCQDFCDPASRDGHCGLCKCRGCDFCACASEHVNDTAVEMCQPWCNADQYDSHCGWCACKGCGFCKAGGKSCQSFFVTGDSDHEDCEEFCAEEASNVHCGYCKCKRCGFCKAEAARQKAKEKAALALPAGQSAIPADAVTCFSGLARDSLYEQCEGFCNDVDQCKLCKCRSCHMCSASCHSGIAGDVSTMACSSSCDPALADAVCMTCRCRGCSFCSSDGTPSLALSGGTSGLETADSSNGHDESKADACVPFNSKDIDHRACLSHCSLSNKAAHCETCKCASCGFCQGFRACSSGQPHDTKWEDCDVSCSGKASCALCKCRQCSACAPSTNEPCDSGILHDAPFLTCLSGVCSASHRESHCQLCGCRGCAFCDGFDQPPPPPPPPRLACARASPADTSYRACGPLCSPAHAATQCATCGCADCSFCTDTQQPCTSKHLADASTDTCKDWCKDLGDADHMCTFCHCKTCDFCVGLEERSKRHGIALTNSDYGEARGSELPPSEGCPVGAELEIIREKQQKSGSWHYEARLRFGSWQPDAVVTVDFSRAHREVEINGDDLCCAKELGGGDAWMKVKLGARGDQLQGFAFEFKLKNGRLNLERAPASIECTGVRSVPHALPHPPPPPHLPFSHETMAEMTSPLISAALIREHAAANPCLLGGRVKITGKWNGGTSFRASVILAVWQAGAEVVVDFTRQGMDGNERHLAWREEKAAEKATVSKIPKAPSPVSPRGGGLVQPLTELRTQTALNAVPLSSPSVGVLRFRLSSTGDQDDGFSFVGSGNREVGSYPTLRCTPLGAAGESANAANEPAGLHAGKTAASPPATIADSCAPLGLSYTIEQRWAGGFKALVAVRAWQPGAQITLRYETEGIALLDQWYAARLPASGGTAHAGSEISLVLGEAPDEEHHGFGFSARGSQGATEGPAISCAVDKSGLALTAVPLAQCGMGASYSIVTNAHAGEGSSLVRVRLRQWQMGASVSVTFAESVETHSSRPAADGSPPAAIEFSDALGAEHTFELGSHPDEGHGFQFAVRSSSSPVHVQHLLCKPRATDGGSESVTKEIALKKGSPEAPSGLQAKASGCDSIDLQWMPAIDNGYSISGYRVYIRRREAPSDAAFETLDVPGGGGATHFTLSGLSGGTTYYVKLRARNQIGEGKYSARAEADTPSGGVPKSSPAALSSLSSPDCQTMKLKLPTLRPGCHGESFLSVQMRTVGRSGHGWNDAMPMATESEVRIGGLDPWEVYEFRAVPHNSKGAGPPGESTGPVMVGIEGSALTAPQARAVGSASVSLSWPDVAGACRPSVRWRVMVARRDNSTFQELTSDAGASSSYSAHPLRCPPPGCVFRVQAGDAGANDVANGRARWAVPSSTSGPVLSTVLPELEYGGVRLELWRRSEHPEEDMIQTSLNVAVDLSSALSLDDSAPVTVREVYGAGKYVVVDIRGARQGSAREASSASLLAQQLALLAAEGVNDAGGLRAGEVTYDVISVKMLAGGDGQLLTAVHVGDEAAQKLNSVTRWYGNPGGGTRPGSNADESSVFARARKITMFIAVAAVFAWLCSKMGGGGGYRAVDQAE